MVAKASWCLCIDNLTGDVTSIDTRFQKESEKK